MPTRVTAIILVALLAVIIGVPFVLRPRNEAATAATSGPRLVIITPHNEQMRFEFERAFNRWRVEQGKPAVVFDWRTSGGTSDLRKQVLTEFSAEQHRAARTGRPPRSIGYDLFFGGGDFEHDRLADGVVIQRDGQSVRIPATEPISLPPGLLEEVFPEPTIGGERLYRPDMLWVGTALSSFGIVYNRDVLAMLDLPEPRTWADLQDERYLHWLALADPAHSGSIAATYNVILRRHGWTEGWALLRRLFANGRYFVASASKVPVDVSAGEAAAGMCIDFYGRFQAGAIHNADGSSRVGYVDPPFVTAITADPISIIRDAPNREIALEFIAWLLSVEAQNLWQKRLGTPGGPLRFELRRLPVRRDVYTPEHMQYWADDIDPFAIASPLPAATPNWFSAVGPITHAMAVDIHSDLIAAWKAIVRHPNHPHRAEMLQLFDAMPPDLTLTWPDAELAADWANILADPDHLRYGEVVATLDAFQQSLRPIFGDAEALIEARLRWTKFFRDNYRKIRELAERD